MASTLFQYYFAIFMVAVIGALFIWFMRSESAASTGRMMGMMKRVGLDPGSAVLGRRQTGAALKAARRRCGRCPREDFCDRWLAGEVEGDDAFCPNAGTFRVLSGAPWRAG